MKQEKKINKIAFKWFPLNITEITFRKTTKEKRSIYLLKIKKTIDKIKNSNLFIT